ncbi:MAG: ornithine cyclodeaminase [Candidatus Thermoplasmatota archaeon]|jgi:alanine dehydrogenase|nr:ornithine cyclodeaminase [Candidatus Thermoplasmatota archaeon]MCL5791258.1 ornithine cyclodeaminase [Candidatus Thermoplasmatota archaeon]
MIYITEQEVRENLQMDELVKDLEVAFTDYGRGDAQASPRDRIYTGESFLNTMPAYWKRYGLAGLKTYIAGRNGVKFVVIMFQEKDPDNFFVIEADRLGQMRTGALPAAVTKKVHGGGDFLLIGSGFQAETQMEAMALTVKLERASVYSRNHDHASRFVDKMSALLGIEISVCGNLSEVRNFQIITAVTNSSSPFLRKDMMPEKYHLNLVGANLKNRSEAAPDLMNSADIIVVEHLEQALRESAEVESVTERNRIVELRDLMAGNRKIGGKTVFKSMGIGLEDIVAGRIVARNMGYLR